MKKKQPKSANQLVVELLDWALTEKTKRNEAYSRRALARDLGMSPAYLSLVFSGKKKLSIKKAKEIADKCQFPEAKKH